MRERTCNLIVKIRYSMIKVTEPNQTPELKFIKTPAEQI